MIQVRALPPTPSSRPLRLLALPASWPPTLLWIAGIGLCLLVALATLPRTAWSKDGLPVGPVPAIAAVAAPAKATSRTRCAHCGVVELIRALEPVGALPAEYEFTVRLRDGSARVSTVVASTASAWSVGDSILLVGGL